MNMQRGGTIDTQQFSMEHVHLRTYTYCNPLSGVSSVHSKNSLLAWLYGQLTEYLLRTATPTLPGPESFSLPVWYKICRRASVKTLQWRTVAKHRNGMPSCLPQSQTPCLLPSLQRCYARGVCVPVSHRCRQLVFCTCSAKEDPCYNEQNACIG